MAEIQLCGVLRLSWCGTHSHSHCHCYCCALLLSHRCFRARFRDYHLVGYNENRVGCYGDGYLESLAWKLIHSLAIESIPLFRKSECLDAAGRSGRRQTRPLRQTYRAPLAHSLRAGCARRPACRSRRGWIEMSRRVPESMPGARYRPAAGGEGLGAESPLPMRGKGYVVVGGLRCWN